MLVLCCFLHNEVGGRNWNVLDTTGVKPGLVDSIGDH